VMTILRSELGSVNTRNLKSPSEEIDTPVGCIDIATLFKGKGRAKHYQESLRAEKWGF
jgi:hypothetical protein